ncbi:MAG TPA: glycosyltransferase family 1 protein [Chloroflexi bacterium]|nr:glycosyltransferase family 1 protein [Chloroflexota bacterium]
MRIAFATPEYITEQNYYGGLANYLQRLAQVLTLHGHEVHIITYSEAAAGHFLHDDIHIHRVIAKNSLFWLNRLTRWRLMETAYILSHSWQTYLTLKALHQAQPLDLIQYANYRLPGLFAANLLPVPYTVRASSFTAAWNAALARPHTLDRRIGEWLEAVHFRACRYIFAPSFALANMLSEELGLRSITVIPSPFYIEVSLQDPSVFNSFLKNKNYLLYFGRLQRHKGFEVLAQALPQVLQQCSDMHVAIVGEDLPTQKHSSMREYARQLAGAQAQRLVFIDSLKHEQLYPIIENARLIVLPSLIDNLPNACLESMGLGRPVVGTRGASFDELIEDQNTGFLVEPDNVEALTSILITAWYREDLDEIGLRAKKRIEQLHPQHTVAELLAYYRTLM